MTYCIYILKLLEISYLKYRFCLNCIWLIQFIFHGIEMADSGKNYEVEDLEELDDNNLDGNNEEIDNAVDVKFIHHFLLILTL